MGTWNNQGPVPVRCVDDLDSGLMHSCVCVCGGGLSPEVQLLETASGGVSQGEGNRICCVLHHSLGPLVLMFFSVCEGEGSHHCSFGLVIIFVDSPTSFSQQWIDWDGCPHMGDV